MLSKRSIRSNDPEWGGERIKKLVADRSDWCSSRQRRWGVPIPIVYCKNCGKPIINEKTVAAISDMFEKEGSDSWYLREPEEFLPKDLTCDACGCGEFVKEMDIMDVWFDSGVSHAAVCNEAHGLHWPADLYLEGADQYRGWFSPRCSLPSRGKALRLTNPSAPTAGSSTARARPCINPLAMAWRRTRSRRNSEPTSCASGWPPPIITPTSASLRIFSSSLRKYIERSATPRGLSSPTSMILTERIPFRLKRSRHRQMALASRSDRRGLHDAYEKLDYISSIPQSVTLHNRSFQLLSGYPKGSPLRRKGGQ